jgi:EamA-like transporter family
MNVAGVLTDVASQQIAPSPPLAAVPTSQAQDQPASSPLCARESWQDGGYRSGRPRRRVRRGSRSRVRDRQGRRCRRLDRPWQHAVPGATTWLAVLGVAALSTALACSVFLQILRRSGASDAMLVTLLITVTTIPLGYLVLGESISLRQSTVRA